MGVENFSLGISAQTTGTAEIEKLVAALNGYVSKVEEVKKRTEASAPSTAGYEKFAEGVKQAIQNPLAAAGDVAKGLLTALGPVGAAVTSTVGVFSALGMAGFEAMKGLGQLGEQINSVTLRTGLSTKEVGEFGFAAKMVGRDIGIFESAMRKLSIGLSDAGDDGRKAKEGLKALGVEARDANGNLKPTSDIFLQISSGMSHMSNAIERNNALAKIFGRTAVELVPVLSELGENVARAKELGLGVTDEELTKFKKYDQQVVEIEASWDRLARKMKQPLVGVISFIISANGEGGKAPSLDEWRKMGVHVQGATYAKSSTEQRNDARLAGMAPLDGGVSQHLTMADRTLSFLADYESRQSGARIVAAGKSQYERSREGLQALLGAAVSREASAYSEFVDSAGKPDDVVKAKEKAWREATAAAERYRVAVKEASKAEEDAKKVTDLVAEAHKAANISDAPFLKQTATWIEKAGGAKMSPAQSNSFYGDVTRIMLAESGTEWDKLLKEYWKTQEDAEKRFRETVEKNWADVYTLMDESGKRRAGAAIDLGKEGIGYRYGGELAGAQRNARLSTALFGATSTSQTAGIEYGYASQVALAGQVYDIERRRMEEMLRFEPEETRALKAQTAELQLKADMQKSMDDARVEREIAYADLQRQNLDKYKEGLGRTFDALVASGHGGLQSMFQSLLLGNVRQFAMNLGGSLFEQAGGMLGKLGASIPGGEKLLKGTLLDPANAQKIAIDANTLATQQNTMAIEAMRLGGAGAPGGGFGTGGWTGSGLSSGLGIGNLPFTGLSGSDEVNYANNLNGSPFGAFGDQASSAKGGSFFSSPAFGRTLAGAAALGASAFAAYDGFSRGGARGALEGTGGLAGAASGVMMLAGVSGPAAPILAGVGLALGAITTLFGDPKQIRSNQISEEIRNALYMAPPSVSLSADMNGSQTRTNRAGQIESTPWNAFRYQVNDPHYLTGYNESRNGSNDPRNGEIIPGTVIYQTFNMTVHAADAKSFVDQRNVLALAVQQAMQEGHPLNYQVQAAAGRG